MLYWLNRIICWWNQSSSFSLWLEYFVFSNSVPSNAAVTLKPSRTRCAGGVGSFLVDSSSLAPFGNYTLNSKLIDWFLFFYFSVKYVGVYSYLLGLALVSHDFWERVLGNLKLSKLQVFCQFLARSLAFFVVPLVVYIGVFYIHLSTLTNAGPHDSAMSSAFQASLEVRYKYLLTQFNPLIIQQFLLLQGGLSSIVRGQPLEVVHGSQITLRHTHGNPCWLHSHDTNYPVKYADKRGSSHQQQVTCYHAKDINNWWIVKRPNRTDLVVAAPLDKISHGDEVQLVHGITGRNLNSHNVAAPASPTKQEISCYIDHNVSMSAQDIWRVEISNREEVGDVWHALESMVFNLSYDNNFCKY